jgi:hypothetical protein
MLQEISRVSRDNDHRLTDLVNGLTQQLQAAEDRIGLLARPTLSLMGDPCRELALRSDYSKGVVGEDQWSPSLGGRSITPLKPTTPAPSQRCARSVLCPSASTGGWPQGKKFARRMPGASDHYKKKPWRPVAVRFGDITPLRQTIFE